MAAMAVAAALLPAAPLDAVDVHVEFDKTFDFRAVQTWGWNPGARGHVIVARTQHDDPEAFRQAAEPLIAAEVSDAMARLGLREAPADPALTVTYYLLLSTNMSGQTVGQFLPAVSAWGLPPFAPATQSLRLMHTGSLVLDLRAGQTIVWRGVARTELKPHTEAARREAVVKEAVRDLLRRYPKR
jgi:hypothetical protein